MRIIRGASRSLPEGEWPFAAGTFVRTSGNPVSRETVAVVEDCRDGIVRRQRKAVIVMKYLDGSYGRAPASWLREVSSLELLALKG